MDADPSPWSVDPQFLCLGLALPWLNERDLRSVIVAVVHLERGAMASAWRGLCAGRGISCYGPGAAPSLEDWRRISMAFGASTVDWDPLDARELGELRRCLAGGWVVPPAARKTSSLDSNFTQGIQVCLHCAGAREAQPRLFYLEGCMRPVRSMLALGDPYFVEAASLQVCGDRFVAYLDRLSRARPDNWSLVLRLFSESHRGNSLARGFASMPPAWFENCNCSFHGNLRVRFLLPGAPLITAKVTGCFTYVRLDRQVQDLLRAEGCLPRAGRGEDGADGGEAIRLRPLKMLLQVDVSDSFMVEEEGGGGGA